MGQVCLVVREDLTSCGGGGFPKSLGGWSSPCWWPLDLALLGQSNKERPCSAAFGHQGSPDHHCTVPESYYWIPGFQSLPEDAPDGVNLRGWSEPESAPFL